MSKNIFQHKRYKNEKIMRIKPSAPNRVTLFVIGTITIIITLFLIAVVGYVMLSSVLVKDTNSFGGIKFSLDGYKMIFTNEKVLRGFCNSILYTVVGTAVSLTMTILSAYVMSRPDFRMSKLIFIVFTGSNFVNGGLVPTYLLVRNLNLLNSMWALILPSAISVYNVIMLMSYFKNKVPSELYDAARLDGCGHWKYLISIVIPLTLSFIAVIAFFYAVSYWNSYFNASIYITESAKLPLQNVLKQMLISNRESLLLQGGIVTESGITAVQRSKLFEYALIIFSSAPMIILLMFIRKSFKNLGDESGKVV